MMNDETGHNSKMVNLTHHLNAQQFAGELLMNEPMSRHTSWRTGGNAEYFFVPANIKDLSQFLGALPKNIPVMWVGKGSNLLVRDGGLTGIVISVESALGEFIKVTDTEIKVDAGLSCVKAARQAAKEGLSGIEFLAGIPGTIGGALAMNAGAWGGETWVNAVSAETINRQGKINHYQKSDFEIGYRSVSLPTDEWFISATFKLTNADPELIKERIRNMLDERAARQPLGQLSCGSVFRNPEGDHAARLIEAAGLKGYQIGGAVVSEKHANFIVNTGNASASDIESLIQHIANTVRNKHAVDMQAEVKIVGKDNMGETN